MNVISVLSENELSYAVKDNNIQAL